MKGAQGLILAVGLGLAGALFNWMYLINRASEKANVYFIGIKPNVALNSGDKIKSDHIELVGVPKDAVGNLNDFAVPFETNTSIAGQSVVGQTVWRVVQGGRLLMKEDLKTPPPELRLEPDEQAMFVPIDTRSVVTSVIVPGDQVMFQVPKFVPGKPTPAMPPPGPPGQPIPDPANAENPGAANSELESIGPFKVLSVGNRLGTAEVMKSAHISQLQDNVIMISVKPKDQQKALRLQSRLDASNYRQVGVWLVSRQERQ